jgi:mannose-6-phosphate isomerase
MSIFRLVNSVQEYPWGSKTAIPGFLGIANAAEKPQAELWMGAHPKAPSKVVTPEGIVSLIDHIKKNPEGVLGRKVAKTFGQSIPFLFKVLAAEEPLSIQAHPSKSQAEEGFRRENRQGIPLDAFQRNYRDSNHKPEILCALEPFWALRGFRPLDEIIKNFRETGGDYHLSLLDSLDKYRDPDSLKEFYKSILSMDPKELNRMIQMAEELGGDAGNWIRRLNSKYPGDPGVLAPLYLNLVKLNTGEALFLKAGVLHAYLEGTGVELMSNSDNVLRGGLTKKHVDIPELLKTLDYHGASVQICKPEASGQGTEIYLTPVPDFQLARIRLDGEGEFPVPDTLEILLCTAGGLVIQWDGGSLPVAKGQSLLVEARTEKYHLRGKGTLFRAAAP